MKKKSNQFFDFSFNGLDTNLIIMTLFLVVFGLIMIYSASYYICSISSTYDYDPMNMLKKQAVFSLIGLVFMYLVSSVNYHFWKTKGVVWSAFILAVILSLLLLTRKFGEGSPLNFSITANGATRWLKFGPINFQVAEPVKIAVIVITAYLAEKWTAKEVRWKKFGVKQWRSTSSICIPGLFLAGFLGLLSNNMSSAIIIALLGIAMYYAWHPKHWQFYVMLALAAVGVAIFIYYILNLPQETIEEIWQAYVNQEGDFRLTRMVSWLHPYQFQKDASFQSLQALYAIGSGGLFGKGLGNSIQKLGSVPEPANDFIFSIICEELGIVGASLLILMFIYLLYRIFKIASAAEDVFGRMLATGVFLHFGLQVVMNLAVVTSSMPNTGVTLPFISYGGTASVLLMIEIGMVLNVRKWGIQKRLERDEARVEALEQASERSRYR